VPAVQAKELTKTIMTLSYSCYLKIEISKNRDTSFKASLPIRTKEKNRALANKNAHILC
jgi:hypothetical protein